MGIEGLKQNNENPGIRPDIDKEKLWVVMQFALAKLNEKMTETDYLAVGWNPKVNAFFYTSIEETENDFIPELKLMAEHRSINYYNNKGMLVFDGVNAEKNRTEKQNNNLRYQDYLKKEKEWLIKECSELSDLEKNEVLFVFYDQDFKKEIEIMRNEGLSEEQKFFASGISDDAFPEEMIDFKKRVYDKELNLIYDGTDVDVFFKQEDVAELVPKNIKRDPKEFNDKELENLLKIALSKEDYSDAIIVRDELFLRDPIKYNKNIK